VGDTPNRRGERPPTTIAEVHDALERVARDVARLGSEVGQLKDQLKGLPRPRDGKFDSWKQPEGTATVAPRREILAALFSAKDDLPSMAQVLKAVSKDLDGALIDVRAARLALQSIDDDPDASASARARNRKR
jgi:hypothetical protein